MSTLNRIERGYKDRVRKATLRVTHADLTEAARTQAITGPDIPPDAVVLGYRVTVAEAFTDGSSGTFTCDLGDGSTANLFANDLALGSIAKLVPAAGLSVLADGGNWTVTVDGSVNVDTATAGDVTVVLFYVV